MTRDEMITENIGLVKWVILKYFKAALMRYEFDDLLGAGCIGLIKAVDSYDDRLGKFSTYAVRGIRMEISLYRRYNDFDVHVPANVKEKMSAEEYGKYQTLSLDAKTGCGNDRFEELMPCADDVEGEAIVNIARDAAMRSLTKREREIATMRLDCRSDYELAQQLGCSHQRVQKCYSKFRKSLKQQLAIG